MVTAPSRTRIGSMLAGRWRLVQKLGDGGIGEVYAAEPLPGGPRVAVKMLRSEFLADARVVLCFAEQGRACMSLVHPNIVRVLECAAAEDGLPFLVTELLEGVLLSAYTQKGGRVPIAQAVPIMQGILAGLAAAHAQGTIHCDLKPDNVFLNRHSSGTFVVKVMDFGVAKVMDAAGGMGSRTRSGMLLGSPAYMSPEQARRATDVDHRADVWSAGVMLYEMLSGRVAFPAPTEYARLAAVLTTEPEGIDRIDPALARLAPVVARALRKNRTERFSSALEMAHALAGASSNAAGRVDTIGAEPLHRLPEVPSLFTPSLAHPSHEAQTAPLAVEEHVGRQKPGGTLASAEDPRPVTDPPPLIAVASMEGTLPSKNLPALVHRAVKATRAVRPAVVVALVAGALVAGFLLGWAVGRMTAG